MKRLLGLAIVFALPAVMIACGKSSDDSTASTPLNFNNGVYQQYGFYPYPTTGYGYQNPYQQAYMPYSSYYGYQQQNTCGCTSYGSGFLPAFIPGGTMGCVSPQVYQPVYGMLGIFQVGAANNQWTNIPQVSNLPAGGQCGQAAQACFPSNTANGGCPTGYRCATATGAPVGLCIVQ